MPSPEFPVEFTPAVPDEPEEFVERLTAVLVQRIADYRAKLGSEGLRASRSAILGNTLPSPEVLQQAIKEIELQASLEEAIAINGLIGELTEGA